MLIVELDTQTGVPTEHEALRVAGNLATSAGDIAPPELVASVGIGTRVRMVFKDVAAGLAVPLWTVDEAAARPPQPGATRRPELNLNRQDRQCVT